MLQNKPPVLQRIQDFNIKIHDYVILWLHQQYWGLMFPLREDADSLLLCLSWENLDLAEKGLCGRWPSLGRIERGEVDSMNSSGICSVLTLVLERLTRLNGEVDLRTLAGTSRFTGTARGGVGAWRPASRSSGRDCAGSTLFLAPPPCITWCRALHQQINWSWSSVHRPPTTMRRQPTMRRHSLQTLNTQPTVNHYSTLSYTLGTYTHTQIYVLSCTPILILPYTPMLTFYSNYTLKIQLILDSNIKKTFQFYVIYILYKSREV